MKIYRVMYKTKSRKRFAQHSEFWSKNEADEMATRLEKIAEVKIIEAECR